MGTILQQHTHVQGVLPCFLQGFLLKSLYIRSEERTVEVYQQFQFGFRADTTVHQPLPSKSFMDSSPFHLQLQTSSQINIDSVGHSWSLPLRSEPHWGRTRSSRPPSPPGLWYRRTAPGRRCLWSAEWRHVPRWLRHGPTSPRSASHTPLPASLLPGGSPRRLNEMRWNLPMWELSSQDHGRRLWGLEIHSNLKWLPNANQPIQTGTKEHQK